MFAILQHSKTILTFTLALGFATTGWAQTIKPDMHLLAIGISEFQHPALKQGVVFASKDAQDVVRFFQGQEGKLYGRVHTHTLINERATKGNIEKALLDLKSKVKASDCCVVYLASHGGMNQVFGFNFVTHDYNPLLPSTALAYSTLTSAVASLPGKRFLILDACHSGGVTGDIKLTGQAIGQGLVTIASSMGDETSGEANGNGHFTRALLEGLEGKADVNKDGTITLGELAGFLSDRVPALSNGRQNPTWGQPTTIRLNLPFASNGPASGTQAATIGQTGSGPGASSMAQGAVPPANAFAGHPGNQVSRDRAR